MWEFVVNWIVNERKVARSWNINVFGVYLTLVWQDRHFLYFPKRGGIDVNGLWWLLEKGLQNLRPFRGTAVSIWRRARGPIEFLKVHIKFHVNSPILYQLMSHEGENTYKFSQKPKWFPPSHQIQLLNWKIDLHYCWLAQKGIIN